MAFDVAVALHVADAATDGVAVCPELLGERFSRLPPARNQLFDLNHGQDEFCPVLAAEL